MTAPPKGRAVVAPQPTKYTPRKETYPVSFLSHYPKNETEVIEMKTL